MMNDQKQNRAWSWKVTAFLPMIALLLMAFGSKKEFEPSVLPDLSAISQDFFYGEENGKHAEVNSFEPRMAINNDDNNKRVIAGNLKKTERQWSEADFLSMDGLNIMIQKGKIPNWIEPEFGSFEQNGKRITIKRPYFTGFKFCDVQIDSRSQYWMRLRLRALDQTEFQDSIRTYFNYESATEGTISYFHQCTINEKVKMSPQCIFTIVSDQSTPSTDYQKFLNIIGNTVLEVREKYSMEIYKTKYSQLNTSQKEQIDIAVPMIARFRKTPQLRSEAIFNQNSFYVEVKAEGLYVSHESKTSSVDELRTKVESFLRENPQGMFSIMVASRKEEQLNAVKDVLRNSKALNVNFSNFDPIYQANQVDEKPQFIEGKYEKWLNDRIKQLIEGKQKGLKVSIYYSFIIDRNGKVVDIEILRGCKFPEINDGFKKILLEMPEWNPAKKNGEAVRVILKQASGLSII